MINLKILSDNSEVIPYNFNDFQIHAREDLLSLYPAMTAAMHWHTDLEFIYILEGSMIYTVNGNEYLLKKNDGIFINSQQIHGHHCVDNKDCKFLCVIIPLSFLVFSKRIENKFVNSFCYNSNNSHLLLSHKVNWQNHILQLINHLYQICNEQAFGFELNSVRIIYELYGELIKNIDFTINNNEDLNPYIDNLHHMIGYIQKNYSDTVKLQDIADAGNVCRSKCCEIFNDFMHQSPIAYLTSYRISKSIELLINTNMSITSVALECGFNGSSYFTETFRKEMQCTPSQYRKQKSSM